MSFLDRFRSPEARETRARERAEREAGEAAARERLAAEEAERSAADARRSFEEAVGPELAAAEVSTVAEAKLAIKLARLRKKELAAEKRELSAALADHREAWRERQAGRYSTALLGRGTAGRIMRAGIQSKRRAERQANADVVNAYSDARQVIDRKVVLVDRLIIELERMTRELAE